MQYKTPHKIDLEDRVIGPLTMRQFGFVFTGGLIDYLLFTTLAPRYGNSIFAVVAILPTLLSLALAFLKVQDQPFGNALISLVLYFFRGQKFVWQHTEDPIFLELKRTDPISKNPPAKNVQASDLDRLAAIVDQRGWSAAEVNQPTATPNGVSLYGRVISTAEVLPNTGPTDQTEPTPPI